MDHPRRDREDPRDHLRHTTCKDHPDKALPDPRNTCSNIPRARQVILVNTPDNIRVRQVGRPDSSKDLLPVHLTDHPTRVLPKVHPACRPEWSPAPDIRPTRWHQIRVHRRQVRCSREVPAVPAREWPAQGVPTWADQVVQI